MCSSARTRLVAGSITRITSRSRAALAVQARASWRYLTVPNSRSSAVRNLFFTEYGYAEGNGQCFHYLPGGIGGHTAHVSVALEQLNKLLLRAAMVGGKAPGPGFLRGQPFHVTVEMYGQDNPANPRAFDRGQWQGTIGGLRTTAAQAYEKGDNYLKDNV